MIANRHIRATAAAAMVATLLSRITTGQTLPVLHIKIVVTNSAQSPMPVARHALLISDNPATATPRRVLTAADGTVDVRLRPGNYTVESDTPFVFEGKAYNWIETLDIAAGRDATLDLTSANATIEAAPATAPTATAASGVEAPRPDVDSASLLAAWQDSVVELWTPTAHAAGFVVDQRGLVATSQAAIGSATSVEVQLAPAVKVAGKILAADSAQDVAIVWIDRAAVAAVKPVPLACGQSANVAVEKGEKIATIEVPLRRPKGTTTGRVDRVTDRVIESDLYLSFESGGSPVFSGDGIVGIALVDDARSGRNRGNTRVVRASDVCATVANAEKKMTASAAPSGVHLPVEPARPFPIDALKDAASKRGGSLNPYQIASSGFDIAFITPVMTYGVEYQNEQLNSRDRGRGSARMMDAGPRGNPLMDFGVWSTYMGDFPPVLAVRVTPKMVEGFWAKVARGAAMTQGMAIPAIKRFTSGFLRMRAFCGDTEVTPIHPFKLETRISETEGIFEGLYMFDAGALAPSCAGVKLTIYSEKEPQKADTQTVDPKVIQLIWQDFAAFRAQSPQQ